MGVAPCQRIKWGSEWAGDGAQRVLGTGRASQPCRAEQSCHLLLTSLLEEGGPRVSPALLAINAPRQRAASPPPSSWGWWSLMGLTHRVGRSPRAKSPKATPLEETRGSGRLCCGCGAALGQSRLPSTLLLGD